jgi:hypothetical protein
VHPCGQRILVGDCLLSPGPGCGCEIGFAPTTILAFSEAPIEAAPGSWGAPILKVIKDLGANAALPQTWPGAAKTT